MPKDFDLKSCKDDLSGIVFYGYNQENYKVDSLLAIKAFLKYGIKASNIFLFVPDELQLFWSRQNIGDVNVSSCDNFESTIKNQKLNYSICLITGHSGLQGVGYHNKNGSTSFYNCENIYGPFKTMASLQLGIFIFGGCVSKIFDYIDTNHSAASGPKLCVMGASGFESSFNYPCLDKNQPTNVFLSYFCKWLFQPFDVDGDSQLTLMDGFKFASTCCHDLLANTATLDWYLQLEKIKENLQRLGLKKSDYEMLVDTRDQLVRNINIQQTPW